LSGRLSDLRASVHVPDHAAYDAQSVGVAPQLVSIRLENSGTRSVPLGKLDASFASTRRGVAFPCSTRVADTPPATEPTFLAPGDSFTFARLLACSMPLPGRYELQVAIQSLAPQGSDGEDADEAALGAFPIDVTALGDAPQVISRDAEIYAVMAGRSMDSPLPYDAWRSGSYKVVFALINGSDGDVSLSALTLVLSVYEEGRAFSCEEQEEHFNPWELPPGAVQIFQLPVTSAPSEPGRYQVVGRLAGPGVPEVEIARFGLTVEADPYLSFLPEWPRRPAPR
jgi:hypothetical protein